MYKLAIIVGTRPELIKLSSVIINLRKHYEVNLIHTGQNYDYELDEIFYKDLDIEKPEIYLDVAAENVGNQIANVISKSYKVLSELSADALLIYGDTNSCLSAISAKRLKIPVFHMEAGNRCYDDRVPEELNRRIVDHISDINLTISGEAKKYLEKEGIPAHKIIQIGSSMLEILVRLKPQIEASTILNDLQLKEHGFILLSLHREENVDDIEGLKGMLLALNNYANDMQLPIIFSCHPRTRKIIEKIENFDIIWKWIKIIKPIGFVDYIKMQERAYCVISDSGTIFEESSILKFPAITIRDSHERPEAIKSGSVIVVHKKAIDKINVAIEIARAERLQIQTTLDYKDTNVASKVSKIIFSYLESVNDFVWRKY